jgi:hypothetical protein
MEKVLELGGIKFKATPAKDKNGRKGYFIAESDLKKTRKSRLISPKPNKASSKKSYGQSLVEDSLSEMRQYIDGKVKVRPIDEFLKTL